MTLIREAFGDAPWVEELDGFAVRSVDQLATLVGSFQGRLALGQLRAGPDVAGVAPRLAQLGGGRAPSSSPSRPHGLGCRMAPRLERLRFGDRLRARPRPTAPVPEAAPQLPAACNLASLLTPVRDQFYRGTCVAFALTALVESQLVRDQGVATDLSEQYVYYLARLHDPDRAFDGTHPRHALDALVERGVCHESLWPYVEHHDWSQALTFELPVHQVAMLDIDAFGRRLTKWRALAPFSVAAARAELAERRLVCMCVAVFETAWDLAYLDGEVTLPLARAEGDGAEILLDRVVGGHAIALCGYVDTPDRAGGGYFLFKNSWGEGWARESPYRAGCGILPYAYVEKYGFEAFVVE